MLLPSKDTLPINVVIAQQISTQQRHLCFNDSPDIDFEIDVKKVNRKI